MKDSLGETPKRIFSWKQLTGVMVACGLTLVFLMPDDPTLLEDLIRDGKTAEARRVLAKVSPEQREAEALRYAIAEQRIAQIEVGEEPSADDVAAYVVRATKRWQDNDYADTLLSVWINDLPRLHSIEDVWFNLTGNWESLPQLGQTRLSKVLVRLALEREHPGLAAELYAQTYGAAPVSSIRAFELARLYRLAGEPQSALSALEQAEGANLVELRIALLRELNSNDRALTELLRKIENNSPLFSEDILQLVAIARAAGQPARAVPLTRQYLQTNPSDLSVWRGLVMILRESGEAIEAASSQANVVSLSDRDLAEMREWGRLLEGAGLPNEAFDVWIELSLQGDLAALDRLMALNPGLYRDLELADVLLVVAPVENHADYTLILAQILIRVGRYDEAVSTYELYFLAEPMDTTAMIELALLETELYRYGEAAKWLERITSGGDSSPSTRRELADAWVAIGEFDLALEEYRIVAEATGLAEDFGSYFRLARGMGAYHDFVAGLEGVLRTNEATASDYLTLAYGYQLLGEEDKSKVILRNGMTRFPESPEMPMRLAYAFSDKKRYREAQEILEFHPKLGRDLEPTRLYLILMRLNEDIGAEKRFLERELPDVVLNDPESKQYLARIHSSQGRLEVAERLLRELHEQFPVDWDVIGDLVTVLQRLGKNKAAQELLEPLLVEGRAEAWRLAADIASQMGDYGKAEKYQTKYLAMVDPALPTDWGALGDIRLSQGDRVGSKRAYTRALRELQLNLLAEPKPER